MFSGGYVYPDRRDDISSRSVLPVKMVWSRNSFHKSNEKAAATGDLLGRAVRSIPKFAALPPKYFISPGKSPSVEPLYAP